MVNLDQSEYDFFDNMEVITVLHVFSRHFRSINSLFHVFFFTKQDLEVQQKLPILNSHLTILKSYIGHLKLPINEGELMICFVAPAFRMSLDPNQEKFQKLW